MQFHVHQTITGIVEEMRLLLMKKENADNIHQERAAQLELPLLVENHII